MRTIRQNVPPVFDEEGRAIIVQAVVQGDGPPIYLGLSTFEHGERSKEIRFKIPVDPALVKMDQLEEAFAGFDAAREKMVEKIKEEMRMAAMRI